MTTGFDHEKYLKEQTGYIIERVEKYNNKLYLEFGGKLFFDYHASRVLPGFYENAKVKLLEKLKEKLEIVICIYAGAIDSNKIRADFGITYDMDVMRMIDDLRDWDLSVNSVVITRYTNQPGATIFRKKMERRGIRTYTHTYTKGYPHDADVIVSDEGYGRNPYIETTKPLVVVTGPGPGSGKLATCLSQLYHEHKRGVKAGYSKFETFPIWNLPLDHPVNIAYEAATADLKDRNMIDPFHREAYGVDCVNYNRDVEIFPVLKRIFEKITGDESVYKSPTDMGVNRAGFGITDDSVVREAAKQEIIRRYFKCLCEYKKGLIDRDTAEKVEAMMKNLGLDASNRKAVAPAREAAEKARKRLNNEYASGAAMILPDGQTISGKDSNLMNAYASLILNAIKALAGIEDKVHIISAGIIEPIIRLKKDSLGSRNPVLNMEEILIALSISAVSDTNAAKAVEKMKDLKGAEAHSTNILNQVDETIFRKLGINITSDPNFPTKELFYI
ncbi:MAG: DUF1846 domain-containing protein [Clostridia bacterium]